jgi:hypothetical protein
MLAGVRQWPSLWRTERGEGWCVHAVHRAADALDVGPILGELQALVTACTPACLSRRSPGGMTPSLGSKCTWREKAGGSQGSTRTRPQSQVISVVFRK